MPSTRPRIVASSSCGCRRHRHLAEASLAALRHLPRELLADRMGPRVALRDLDERGAGDPVFARMAGLAAVLLELAIEERVVVERRARDRRGRDRSVVERDGQSRFAVLREAKRIAVQRRAVALEVQVALCGREREQEGGVCRQSRHQEASLEVRGVALADAIRGLVDLDGRAALGAQGPPEPDALALETVAAVARAQRRRLVAARERPRLGRPAPPQHEPFRGRLRPMHLVVHRPVEDHATAPGAHQRAGLCVVRRPQRRRERDRRDARLPVEHRAEHPRIAAAFGGGRGGEGEEGAGGEKGDAAHRRHASGCGRRDPGGEREQEPAANAARRGSGTNVDVSEELHADA